MFEGAVHQPRGGRVFAITGALVIGLLTGFAGGFVVGQRSGSVPGPQAAAVVPSPAEETFTEAAIAEPAPKPLPVPEPVSPIAAAQSSAAPAPPAPLAPSAPTEPPEPTAPPEPATLTFDSRPIGAQVFLDGASVGRTPLVMPDVKTGTHRVRLELAGHRTWVTVVNVEPGTRVRVGASLER